MFSLPSLDSTLGVLSAMVTPAVMILATSSLILTTTNRLVRIVDRVREMLPEFETLARSAQGFATCRWITSTSTSCPWAIQASRHRTTTSTCTS